MTPEELRARLRFAEANAQHTPRWNVDQGGGTASLHIYGVIGGYWDGIAAADLVPAIRDLDVATLDVYVNSPGGDVYDGIAIRNALRQHAAHVVVHVDGLAASAASFIACAGDEVVMGANSELMIHDAWTIGIGNAEDMRTVADDLDRISDNIAAMYAAKAGGEPTEWRTLMQAETWYTADEAVAAGLADRLDTDDAQPAEDEPAAAALFDLTMYAHAGRQAAPAPTLTAALAPTRKDTPMNRTELAAALNNGTITQAQYDAAISAHDALDAATAAAPAALAPVAAAPGVPVPVEYQAGPSVSPAPAASVTDRPRSFNQVATEVVDAAGRHDMGGILRTVNDALGEVGVATDDGNGFIGRPDWLGEVWQAHTAGRPWIDSLGGASPLTGTKLEGFRWAHSGEYTGTAPDVEGRVAPYAGNFAEVPTGRRKTVKVEAEADRWGFGTKVDRIFTDLGSPDLVASLFGLLGMDFDADSDAAVRDAVLAAATQPVDDADAPIVDTSVLAALTAAVLDLKRIGATVSKVWVAEDLFTAFSALKIADLPAWLANALGFVDLVDGSVSIDSKLNFDVDFGLGDGQLVAYDRRAITVRQSPQVRLEALDIAHGAVDIGFFAYGGQLVNDERAILLRTVTA